MRQVRIERLAHARDLALPAYASEGAVGMDLLAAVPEEAPVTLAPGERAAVPTGIRIALPADLEAQVRPRSGLALHQGVTLLNAPGTIDPDYRGEIRVILINHGAELVRIVRGARIAQLVLAPFLRIVWQEGDVRESETGRGAAGFGSTGGGVRRDAGEDMG